jgi:hypothetical protein
MISTRFRLTSGERSPYIEGMRTIPAPLAALFAETQRIARRVLSHSGEHSIRKAMPSRIAAKKAA